MRKLLGVVIVSIPLILLSAFAPEDKIGPNLEKSMQVTKSSDSLTVWVQFTDKGPDSLVNSYEATDILSERSVERRRLRKSGDVIDFSDLPVNPTYIDEVSKRVAEVRFPSRWFNSLSVRATETQIVEVAKLGFVEKLSMVRAIKKTNTPSDVELGSGPLKAHDLDYGRSQYQLNVMRVPEVHDTGNYGQGVMIGMLDSGVYDLNHEAFDSLRVVATYDFVADRESISPPKGSHDYGIHGMMTLSAIAGFKEGKLIGPAFKAEYVLARTEAVSPNGNPYDSESPLEEDNWVRAIEWADSIGIDIASTSLGYLKYGRSIRDDHKYESWTWRDMDGNSTLITRASDMAASKGIVVVNSAGNSGGVDRSKNPRKNSLGAPADGDSVIAVGAVDLKGRRTSFSSVGPGLGDTLRIKPDVMAPGLGVVVASRGGYRGVAGTSFSGPLTGGVTGLILSDCPRATPMEVRDALRTTARRGGADPNYQYGWGIVNAPAAIEAACSN